ncbi:MAG: hypothetical protein ACP5JG_05605 [Anaerolineae bacterium]
MSVTKPLNTKGSYRNFNVAVYARAYEVEQMADLDWLKRRFDLIDRAVKVDKVYLETHRDRLIPDEATINGARQFFAERGVATAGGITYTVNERRRFETYCYTRPDHREKVKEIAVYTARLFDEVILDDFFFTNCKCPSCIKAKGDRSWSEFRLELMAEAARDLVVGPAREVNPDVAMVIKYPNWYEHFHGLGFNLEVEPGIFDRLYTGTETRDPIGRNQHLQQYESYLIFRYFENIKPGANGGGWVDTFGIRYLDRYAEQLWLTLFAKAPEITLFDFRSLVRSIDPALRASWQDLAPEPRTKSTGVSFDFDDMMADFQASRETPTEEPVLAVAAGHALQQMDAVLGELGSPVGVPSYRPFHASGEDFLHNYLGMLGVPIDLRPEFPAEADTVLLTAAAQCDPEIVDKIKRQLMDGKTVVVTSGLFKALQERGIRDIVEVEVTDRKALVKDFGMGWRQVVSAASEILMPHLRYMTNDSWEEISGLTRTTGHPFLHMADYADGRLYILTIPDNFDDLYRLPPEVLTHVRAILMQDLPLRLEGPGQVTLFVYDNDTVIVESFQSESVDVTLVFDAGVHQVRDIVSGDILQGRAVLDWRDQETGESAYDVTLQPHSFRIFRHS